MGLKGFNFPHPGMPVNRIQNFRIGYAQFSLYIKDSYWTVQIERIVKLARLLNHYVGILNNLIDLLLR